MRTSYNGLKQNKFALEKKIGHCWDPMIGENWSPHSADGSNPKKSRNLFNRIKSRSKSVVNLNREKSSSNYFSWFSRKSKPNPTPTESNGTTQECTRPKLQNNGTSTFVAIGDYDRQISASHSNLNAHSSEMKEENGFSNASTSTMPSYINISLVANGYSKSRTNLHNILSRSGDVHNLIIDGSEITDLTKEFKSVIFVNDSRNSPEPSYFSFTIPQLELKSETVVVFESFTDKLEKLLTQCVESSEAKLQGLGVSDEAREAILVAAGHTRVLLKSKIKKMRQLIEKHKENTGEVTLNDLGSFWTMLDIEVSKIRDQFALVEKFRLNDWQKLPVYHSPVETKPKIPIKPKSTKIMPKKSDSPRAIPETPRTRPNVKDFLAAKRKELAESQKLDIDNGCETITITT
uniref:Uncharacterized protein n=1 Tax=Panagrolaimus sp. JU765 TaxID=591449 RepID=A0AC34RNR2_9BILA